MKECLGISLGRGKNKYNNRGIMLLLITFILLLSLEGYVLDLSRSFRCKKKIEIKK